MALTSDQEKDIKELVSTTIKQHYKKPSAQFNGLSYDRTLLERIVRVEERIESLSVLMKQTIHFMEKRFESVDKRFEAVDKRFEAMEKMMEKRFEAVDKRFEDMQKYMEKRFEAVDKRFEDMNKRFNSLQWMIGIGFTLMTTAILLSNFLAN